MRVQRFLQELVPLAVVQEVAGSGRTGPDTRYVMHPLVREVAAGMLRALGRSERAVAYTAFASFMLNLVDAIRVGLTSSESLAAQQLMSDELGNIRDLAKVLLELISEKRAPQHVCDCVAVAAGLRQSGRSEQAHEIEQAMIDVQEQRTVAH